MPPTAAATSGISPTVEARRGVCQVSASPARTTARFPPRTRPRRPFTSRVWTYPRSRRNSRYRRGGFSVGFCEAAKERREETS
jgi:hypothetical protein